MAPHCHTYSITKIAYASILHIAHAVYGGLFPSYANYAQSIAIHHHFGYSFQTSSKDFIK
ncbi:hypothetical protein BDE36_2154 [Arcticibacter tournemirensis]|nr:hypothetical protein BDE36_2154 [Arcticibacter tournemirensis]